MKCIYIITNLVNNKIYVGSTTNLKRRITKQAGETLKISNGQLCDYLKGNHKSGKGFHWEYKYK